MHRRWASVVRGPAVLALVCFAAGAGCGGCASKPEAYPVQISYSARKDWIVDRMPTIVPEAQEENGRFEEGIESIPSRGGRAYNPAAAPEPDRTELNTFLNANFGSPASPTMAGDDATRALAANLGLSDDNLAAGSTLFRRHCQECHGLNGDGRGPTGPWLTPHPRDFRQGVFKFVSTNGSGPRKPTRSDLFRTLSNGLPSTAMPSFALRSEDERHRLIDYVMFLSIRGRTEFEVLRTLLTEGDVGLNGDVATEAAAIAKAQLQAWTAAETDRTPVPPSPVAEDSSALADSIRRGHAIFIDAKGGACATCHGDDGRQGKLQYDVWGTLLKPANLTETRRKGGDGAENLYLRIRGGIGPSNMPAAGALTDAQTWDVVHFLRALPYPDKLPADIKDRVYGDGK